jgi:glycosyltransferase involved in cell wall biosynthesis
MSRSPTHIALLSANQFDPRLRDGGSLDALTRLRFLQARGQRVSILSFVPSDVSHKYLPDNLPDGGVTSLVREGQRCRAVFHGLDYCEERVPSRLAEFSAQSGPLTHAIVRALQELQVDYAITVDTGYWPLFAAWQLQVPGCHSFFALNNVLAFARARTFLRFLRGRTVFANSLFLQRRIQEHLGLDSEVWYTALDLPACRAPDGTRGMHLGFSSGGPAKGDDIVIELARQLPRLAFLVVGGGFSHSRAALPGNVTYWGHVADMRPFYSQIRLLLVPSLIEEAFGRVVLEAAANGIPVVANDVGGIPEALGDGGLLIPYDPRQPPDITDLAARYRVEIQRLLDDPALYRRYSQQALARAQRFEQDQQRQLDQFYDQYFRSL